MVVRNSALQVFLKNVSIKQYYSYVSVCKLRCCVVTDLSFSKCFEKRDEKSLYAKLSAH